ncbi:MAG: D-alanine--D-alanine ligase family protein [Sphingomonadales bacterium]
MKEIAIVFGGESVEHDVSILTAIQFMNAMDGERYGVLPVYVGPDGRWWTGKALRDKKFYPLTPATEKNLTRLRLPGNSIRGQQPYFLGDKKGVFSKPQTIPFDLVVPAIHGSNGEDGTLQGLLEFLGIPFAGCNVLAAAATMNKDFTKQVVKAHGVPTLAHLVLTKPNQASTLDPKTIKKALQESLGKNPFPLIVKPCNLGSSIGVTPAQDMDDLLAGLLLCFRLDHAVIIEPFVQNLVEYNVAVSKAFGETRVSVIERPLKENDFLDFKGKYLSGDSQGSKLKTGNSEGMASLNRVMNPPELNQSKQEKIKGWAGSAFDALGLAGSVRIDFLGDEKTGEIWLNEINTIPGSFAYYLWQESTPSVSFTELTTALIEEGLVRAESNLSETDKGLGGAVIFKDK